MAHNSSLAVKMIIYLAKKYGYLYYWQKKLLFLKNTQILQIFAEKSKQKSCLNGPKLINMRQGNKKVKDHVMALLIA